MKLDPTKLKEDESRSNHMVIPMVHPDCRVGEVCFYVVVGFGTLHDKCKNAEIKNQDFYCLQP